MRRQNAASMRANSSARVQGARSHSARLRVAAEWREPDLVAVRDLVDAGRLSLDGLITHRQRALEAEQAYRRAFTDPSCLKMVLDWRPAK